MTSELPNIYTIDLETDPFVYNRRPEAFAAGLYTGLNFVYTWGDNCVTQMRTIVESMEPGIIYAHNGGKFDCFYFMDWFEARRKLSIINSRVVKAHVRCADRPNGERRFHEFRDSYAIMPFALEQYRKTEIQYDVFEMRDVWRIKDRKKMPARECWRDDIVSYLKDDCINLWELCVAFYKRFGDNLTIGGTSMKKIKELHEFEELDAAEDVSIRSRFYYGGRVQCFEKGIVTSKKGFKVFDINQCYPCAMKEYNHPLSKPFPIVGGKITKDTYFVSVYGRNYGAFPKKTDDGLKFDIERDTFHVSIHEYNAALECGLFEPEQIVETFDFMKSGNFGEFVDYAHGLRKGAQLEGDKIGALQYKYFGNSGYGKFSQNPEEFYDYQITHISEAPPSNSKVSERLDELSSYWKLNAWEPCEFAEFSGYIVWRRRAYAGKRYNVATGASITGAARAILMRGIAKAKRPLYCDTDSIVCEDIPGAVIDDTKIGAWKLEKCGNRMAICGRKAYALFQDIECVKLASKGIRATPQMIVDACNGKEVIYYNDAPTFDFRTHEARFIKRHLRMTA